ncbi:MFS transporter [Polynucleobacter sp. UK-Mo-2m-Kol15]|uniref:MFS transporter n=1 Tax=Polynucleobacter sp. UK-Mo-2m-Kol15 TaxID=2576916 RepID=UPI001C0CF9F8|nr:MFS transporter [Polynucleobacter sp. UK-Mo-2m-Kol15]MBU3575008.1 MFS transporter [Polynucleobacter sp. UK-Mo-2m-Kol15]
MKTYLLRLIGQDGWLSPLRFDGFRALWFTWLIANICMWMNDVAAAWTMTSLTTSTTLIALVQTASSLPVLLLGLPSGAMADIVNRKHYFVFTQIWLAINATVLMLFLAIGTLGPYTLLLLTFTNGIGLAMRWPIFAAVVPELVPKDSLQPALALNAIAMNTSRIIGPLVAGFIIAIAGSQYVFGLNMVLSLITTAIVLRWQYQNYVPTLPGERFIGAMRVGVQHVWQSNRMRIIIIRAFLFFLQSTGLIALLPVIAKDHFEGGAGTFTLLLSCLGIGAIIAGTQIPRIRKRFKSSNLVNYGVIILCIACAGVVLAPNIWIASPLMMVCGMAWLAAANSLTTAAQLTLPGWVRARGMSIYQMSLMAGSALGAAVWGKIASELDVTSSILISSVFGLMTLFLIRNYRIDKHAVDDMTPVCPLERPYATKDIDLQAGPVVISIEYHVHKDRLEEFREVMARARKSRLRQGALSWSLFEDAEHIGNFIENFVFETWADYLRRFDRFTVQDLAMQEERQKYHMDSQPPQITRKIASRLKD